MSTPAAELHRLQVLEGGKSVARRAEEARMEVLAFIDEVVGSVERIVNAEVAADVPSLKVVHEAQKLAYRAGKAREQYIDLTEPVA